MATSQIEISSGVEVTADDISNRIDRLPFLPLHFRYAGILATGTFFDAFDSMSMATALTMLVASFHFNFRTGGILLSAAAGGQFFGAIAIGWLAERIGRKWSFVAALGLFALCSLATALATSVNWIIWARAIQGVGLGAEVPVAAAFFAEIVRGRARGLFITLYQSLFAWGLFFAPVAALLCLTLFGPALGWRALFAIGGLPLLIAFVAAFALPELPRWLATKGRISEADATVRRMEDQARRHGRALFPAEPLKVKPGRTQFLELFRGLYARRTFVSWSMAFCAYFISQGFSTWAPTLYMKIGGLPASRAIMLSILQSGITLAWVYTAAVTIDRLGRKTWFSLGFGLATAGALIGVLVTGPLGIHTWPALLACGIVMQSGSAIAASVVFLYLPEIYPTRMRAWGTATGSSLNRLGAFLAPSAVGFMMAQTGSIALVFVLFAAVALYASLVMAGWGLETKRRALEELSP